MDESKEEWIVVTTRTNQIVEEEWGVLIPKDMTKQQVIDEINENGYALFDFFTRLHAADTIDTVGLTIMRIE